MQNSKVLKSFLIVSGLLLTFIGGSTLIVPVVMKTGAGIDIVGNISVINDVRASGALILAVGLLSFFGAFRKKLTYSATLISMLLFLSLGIGRLVSIVVDGLPVDGLVKATGLEIVLGIVGATLLTIYQEKK